MAAAAVPSFDPQVRTIKIAPGFRPTFRLWAPPWRCACRSGPVRLVGGL